MVKIVDKKLAFRRFIFFLLQLKGGGWEPCPTNTIVFVTSRIMNMSDLAQHDIYINRGLNSHCAKQTIVLVGRNESGALKSLYELYGNVSTVNKRENSNT